MTGAPPPNAGSRPNLEAGAGNRARLGGPCWAGPLLAAIAGVGALGGLFWIALDHLAVAEGYVIVQARVGDDRVHPVQHVGGRITQVHAVVGQPVAGGELLATVDAEDVDVRIAELKVQAQTSQMRLDVVRREVQAFEVLEQQQLVARARRRAGAQARRSRAGECRRPRAGCRGGRPPRAGGDPVSSRWYGSFDGWACDRAGRASRREARRDRRQSRRGDPGGDAYSRAGRRGERAAGCADLARACRMARRARFRWPARVLDGCAIAVIDNVWRSVDAHRARRGGSAGGRGSSRCHHAIWQPGEDLDPHRAVVRSPTASRTPQGHDDLGHFELSLFKGSLSDDG